MRVGQFLLRIRFFSTVFFPAVAELLLTILNFRHGVVIERGIAQLSPLLGQILHLGFQAINLGLIFLGVGVSNIVNRQINLVIGIKIKAIQRYVHKTCHTAAANGAGSPFIVEVVGGANQAHQGIAVIGHQVQRILIVVGGYRYCHSQIRLGEIAGVADTLIRGLRHPSGHQLCVVYRVRQGTGRNHDFLVFLPLHKEIRIYRAFGRGNSLHLGEGIHVLICKAQSGHELEIIEAVLPEVGHPGGHHIRLGHPQPCKKSHAQPYNGKNRQIAAQTLADLPQGGLQHRPYHSISSTGTGLVLISSETTIPFFTRITRSAIAVRALLWVIIMTVMPFCRLIS